MKTKIYNFTDIGAVEYQTALNYAILIPQIRYVSAMEPDENGYTFKAFLPFNEQIKFCFFSHEEAITVRRELVAHIVEHRGSEQIIFSNGIDGDIALIGKVLDITNIFTKDCRAGFSVTIASAPYPLHLVFNDEPTAAAYHYELCARVELCRRQRFRQKVAIKA